MVEVLPGCEAWSADGDDVGVLVLHGFTGNPSSVRPLGEALADAGFCVELPRLPGHGTRWEDLQRTTWHDWAREAVAAFERLRARTRAQVAVGLSLGGIMALHLAETRGDDLAGVVTINAEMVNTHPLRHVAPLAKWILPTIPGVGNDIARPGADERAYARTPSRAGHSYASFGKHVHRNLHAVTVPVLVFQSLQDHVIAPENGQRIYDGVSSRDKELVWLERSYHVATLDYDAPEIEKRTAAFVARTTRA
jgi:carboxylesterase